MKGIRDKIKGTIQGTIRMKGIREQNSGRHPSEVNPGQNQGHQPYKGNPGQNQGHHPYESGT
jgi:hypothetical protein